MAIGCGDTSSRIVAYYLAQVSLKIHATRTLPCSYSYYRSR